MVAPPRWHVGCDLEFTVEEAATITLQVAVASAAGRTVDENLAVTLDGQPLAEVRPLAGPHGGTLHQLQAPPGQLDISYRAAVAGPDGAAASASDDYERLLALRPSRYCPSDALLGFAVGEIADRGSDAELAQDVVTWVSNRVAYAPGTSGPLDTAVDTLLAGQGVCRDFAHLGVSLARALGIPTRLVAAYAPGLTPMDFHAVIEAYVDGDWYVLDPTHLAPRASLLRIATGRDAADTAFADVVRGVAVLTQLQVTATCDGALPYEDWGAQVRLP